MNTGKQISGYKIIKAVNERVVSELIKQNKAIYDNIKQELAYYKDKVKKERFSNTLKFLSLPNDKEETYKPIIIDITYIISLFYDLYTIQDLTPIVRKLMKREYSLDADQLASFFMPFYKTEHWHILKSMNKKDAEDFKDFLHRHKETMKLFTKLWKLDIKCYKEDISLLCTSFYNHNDLPSKENYQKMLDSYENN